MIIKAFLLFVMLLMVGGFGYFAITEPAINQNEVTQTLTLDDIQTTDESDQAN